MSDDHLKLREEVRAKLAAWVQPTFRHDGDPDPHPDEDALVDRLTDGVVLPYELKLREALAEAGELRTERVKAYDAYAERVRQLDAENERRRAERVEIQGVLAVAAELIDRLAFDDECDYDHHAYCQAHNLHERPCPHPLGRQFVTAWRAVEAEQKEAADDGHE